jgi:hypothetical protein
VKNEHVLSHQNTLTHACLRPYTHLHTRSHTCRPSSSHVRPHTRTPHAHTHAHTHNSNASLFQTVFGALVHTLSGFLRLAQTANPKRTPPGVDSPTTLPRRRNGGLYRLVQNVAKYVKNEHVLSHQNTLTHACLRPYTHLQSRNH